MSDFVLSPEFFIAGKATFTVSNGKGEQYTYRIDRVEFDNRPGRPMWFAKLLTGPDNTADYTYMGQVMFGRGKRMILTPTSKSTLQDSTPWNVLAWVFGLADNDKPLPQGYAVDPMGRCAACGRPLTRAEGVNEQGYRYGFGPICWEKIQGERLTHDDR